MKTTSFVTNWLTTFRLNFDLVEFKVVNVLKWIEKRGSKGKVNLRFTWRRWHQRWRQCSQSKCWQNLLSKKFKPSSPHILGRGIFSSIRSAVSDTDLEGRGGNSGGSAGPNLPLDNFPSKSSASSGWPDHHHQCNLTKLGINIFLIRFRYHGNALIPSTKTPSPNEGRNYIFEGAGIIMGMEINCKK